MHYGAVTLETVAGVDGAVESPAVPLSEVVGAGVHDLRPTEGEARRGYFPAGLQAEYVVVVSQYAAVQSWFVHTHAEWARRLHPLM